MFEEIRELMESGNWSIAIAKFKEINPTPREFQDYLDSLDYLETETLKDFALLGFYAREYTGGN